MYLSAMHKLASLTQSMVFNSMPVVTNLGSTAPNITSIVPSAGFTQTNNCGASLAGNAACTLNVSFAPTAAGAANGLVTVSYNGTQSTITVSGTGTDFTVKPTTRRRFIGNGQRRLDRNLQSVIERDCRFLW